MLNIQQLYCFRAMSKFENYTKAAEFLYMSQSTLSYTIGTLEKDLGVPLFERHGKYVRLSAYGKKFQEYCEQILDLISESQHALAEMVDPMQGTIKIGHYPSLLNGVFAELINQFNTVPDYQKIRLYLLPMTGAAALDRLQTGSLDLVFAHRISAGNIESIHIFSDQMVLMVPKDHPLAQEKEIDLQEVQDDTWILLANNPRMRMDQERAFEAERFYPRAIIEANSFPEIVNLVEAGFGVAVTPLRQASEKYQVSFVSLRGNQFRRDIYLNYLSEKMQRPVVETFISFARQFGKLRG